MKTHFKEKTRPGNRYDLKIDGTLTETIEEDINRREPVKEEQEERNESQKARKILKQKD